MTSSDTPTTPPESAKTRWALILLYWVVALGVIVALLSQMDRYTHMPSRHNLNVLAKTIRQQWKPNDAIAFYPHWVGNYAIDRKRYKGTFGPKDLKSPKDLGDRKRAWVVYAFKKYGDVPVPAGYTQSSLRRVGKVQVQLLVKTP